MVAFSPILAKGSVSNILGPAIIPCLVAVPAWLDIRLWATKAALSRRSPLQTTGSLDGRTACLLVVVGMDHLRWRRTAELIGVCLDTYFFNIFLFET